MGKTIREVQHSVHRDACSKGWWDSVPKSGIYGTRHMSPDELLAKLMLITTEVAEAAEDVRNSNMGSARGTGGKPIGFPSELADVVIRCMDLAGALGIDLQDEICAKMAHNATRPRRHGGKVA